METREPSRKGRGIIAVRMTVRHMWLCFALALLCACHQKELVYPDSTMIKVTVAFDWTYAPEARPDGMTVIFFPVGDEGRIWRYELKGCDGGAVELPAGNYRMLAFNNDTKYIFYDGVSHFDSYDAYTARAFSEWPPSVIEHFPELEFYRGFHCPDALFCGVADEISVTLCAVSYRTGRPDDDPENSEIKECGSHIIRCWPSPRTATYTCVFRNVANIQGMKRGYCLLSGLAPEDLIAADILSDSNGAYTFLAGRKEDEISGKTVAFGCSASLETHQYLYLIVVLSDGRTASYRYDVSDQILNSPDKRNVMIIINGLELPEVKPVDPDDPTTDFEVAVDDWEMVIINHVVA